MSELTQHQFNPSQKSPGFSPRDECKVLSAREGASAFRPRGLHKGSINVSTKDSQDDTIKFNQFLYFTDFKARKLVLG